MPQALRSVIEAGEGDSLCGQRIPPEWLPFMGMVRGMIKALEFFEEERRKNNEWGGRDLVDVFKNLIARDAGAAGMREPIRIEGYEMRRT